MPPSLVEAIAALYVACGLAYNDPKRAGGEDLYSLAPIAGHPEIAPVVARLLTLRAAGQWEALPSIVQRAIALRASGSARLLRFRLGGTTPGATAIMLRNAMLDQRMGVSKLTNLLLDTSSQ